MQFSQATPTRFAYLNALRGLAALWVLLVHVAKMPQPIMALPSWFDIYIANGTMGVELFFVVSAFSLCLSMPGHVAEERPWLGFALRRFFRIAPLFYVMILVTAFFNPAGFLYNVKTVAANLLFVFNFFPGHGFQTSVVLAGWTIGVEMVFYLIFPMLYGVTKSLPRSIVALLVSLAVAKIFVTLLPILVSDVKSYLNYSVFYRLPIFMCGLVAFYVTPLLKEHSRKQEIGAILLASVPVQFFAVTSNSVSFIDAYHWYGIMFGCLVVGLGLCPIRFLVNDVTEWIGKISFSVYLVHSPIIVLLFPIYKEIQNSEFSRIGGYLVAVGITLICVLPVAALSFYLFENPINIKGKQWATRLAGRSKMLGVPSPAVE
ncbi:MULTISPECIES: acyltransferase family protein [unclassified Phyllobacterium]|uniref:acyltransferase family protein n=1 Tax=unclassified Phyllobacterium TaxID=2638441 RepID=UPI0030130D72